MGKVKAKKETCLQCGATEMENLVRIEEGKVLKIYVRCAKCKTFVARYLVSTYTSDMTYESLLRALRTTQISCLDCRGSMRELEAFTGQVKSEFEKTERQVETTPEKRLIVEMLEEDADCPPEEAEGAREGKKDGRSRP
jgi:hypothetical protein